MMTRRILVLIVLILGFSTSPNSAFASACPNAPQIRLKAGIEAVISKEVRRLNLRSLPAVDTGVERLLNAGVVVTVLSGPSCNGGYNWWRVETAKGERGWVAEGDWEAYFIVPVSDKDRVVDPLEWSCPRWSSRWCRWP